MWKPIALLIALWAAPLSAQQSWGDLDALLIRLSPTGEMVASYWLPNAATPQAATQSIGVVYAHIPGSAGNTTIHVGIYDKRDSGWALARLVPELFGQQPRDTAFFGDRIEITTSMLGPNDARCCPSVAARWSIDPATGRAQRLN